MLAARKLTRRAHRDKSGTFLLEGPRNVGEALAGSGRVIEVFVDEPSKHADVIERAERAGVPVRSVTGPVMKALADASTPQGVVAVARIEPLTMDDLGGASLVLVLDQVRDPGNAGTLVRSAVAAGADGVVFTTGSVDPFGPKTSRAAAGTVLKTKIVRDVALESAASSLSGDGLVVVGADAKAETRADGCNLTRRLALVIGNESWGLTPESRALMDETVAIPMPGPAESLNAGIAGSILLFECVRQRSPRTPG
ncbi:MAG TPA: RNA methyltransferase [Actinomycetota bacterium]|nr:RNA methyltransferase [Actinomycetota bacterium]